MNKQEVFNKVVNHMLDQDEKSMINADDPSSNCAYYGQDGLKCAVGCLIPIDEYNRSFDSGGGVTLDDVVMDCPSLNRLTQDIKSLLDALQTIHDKQDVYNWEYELKGLANRQHLKYERKNN